MTPQDAARKAAESLDGGKTCTGLVWLSIAQGLIWTTPATVMESLERELEEEDEAPGPIPCWDCRLAKRAAIKQLEVR